MIRPEDVKVEVVRAFLDETTLEARIGRTWGLWYDSRTPLPRAMFVEEFRLHQEERLRAGVLRDIYGGIADPLRVVEMALRILGPLSGPPGFLAPEPLAEALAQLQAYADAGNYTPPATTAAPRLPQDMETDAE